MDVPTSIRTSSVVSFATGLGSGPGGPGGSPLLALGGLGAVVASSAVSYLAAGMLPERMRIHWTLGMGPYYGPEFAPTALVLAGVPALVAGLSVGAYWIAARYRDAEVFAAVRPLYVLSVLGTLWFLLALQAVLVVLNL